ncbi:uncharacterized protein ATC70_012989 [Mucor velutinosus]|uniref:phosphoethanolamine N-methyltransferase n=1 Tax=Mucor velutinosus TaxID=708070 RepID=A0AAN7DAW7_9FUNG|nr:hypothetical protein ATC70_012989 [Mucor velutinosus]
MTLFNTSVVAGYLSLLPLIILYTDGYIEKTLIYLHALGITCILYILVNSTTDDTTTTASADGNEIYGLRHLLFNLELPPKTLWFNMGLWSKKNMSFPEACENLVHAVADKMDINPNASVLDVGFGCGDSCLLLADKYKSKVTGITNELSQWKIANERLTSSQWKQNITLLHGSADDLDQILPSTSTFDYITSIDSAYHYNTRWHFLEKAFKRLNLHGSIGLYDLAIEADFLHNASPMQKNIFKFVCDTVHIPIQNLVTVEEYEERLEDIGYEDVQIEQLERHLVFGGLSRSFDQQYTTAMKYGIGVSLSNRIFLKVSSFLFGLLGSKPWLVPIIVKGVKQHEDGDGP